MNPFHYGTFFLSFHLQCLFTIVKLKSDLEIHAQEDLSDGFEFGSCAGGSDAAAALEIEAGGVI